jgi:hypothetical protein
LSVKKVIPGAWFLRAKRKKPGGPTVPQQRLPDWLTVDLVIIVSAIVIIGVGIWIAT